MNPVDTAQWELGWSWYKLALMVFKTNWSRIINSMWNWWRCLYLPCWFVWPSVTSALHPSRRRNKTSSVLSDSFHRPDLVCILSLPSVLRHIVLLTVAPLIKEAESRLQRTRGGFSNEASQTSNTSDILLPLSTDWSESTRSFIDIISPPPLPLWVLLLLQTSLVQSVWCVLTCPQRWTD